MVKFILLFLLFCGVQSIAQQPAFSAIKTTAKQLPPGVKFRGKLSEAWTWKDSLGQNILVLSTTRPVEAKDGTGIKAELFAVQYCKKDTSFKVIWTLNDLIDECPVDITLRFLEGTTSITDLDKDGIAETTVQYKHVCRGDISPANMKLIMHEDSVKYALRGSMWNNWVVNPEISKFPITEKDVNLETLPGYKGTDEEYSKLYGRYRSDKEFKDAPREFLSFARRQWLKYAEEKGDH